VKAISSQGGDVFKFAGDAIIVLWPPSDEDQVTLTRRACQCALDVHAKLTNITLEKGVVLNVKVGVGMGTITILHVGGVCGRMEYLAVGEPLVQAFHSEVRTAVVLFVRPPLPTYVLFVCSFVCFALSLCHSDVSPPPGRFTMTQQSRTRGPSDDD
jgi:hypothetical protein